MREIFREVVMSFSSPRSSLSSILYGLGHSVKADSEIFPGSGFRNLLFTTAKAAFVAFLLDLDSIF